METTGITFFRQNWPICIERQKSGLKIHLKWPFPWLAKFILIFKTTPVEVSDSGWPTPGQQNQRQYMYPVVVIPLNHLDNFLSTPLSVAELTLLSRMLISCPWLHTLVEIVTLKRTIFMVKTYMHRHPIGTSMAGDFFKLFCASRVQTGYAYGWVSLGCALPTVLAGLVDGTVNARLS